MAGKTVEERIREARETGATKLSLMGQGLTELPAEIGQLTGLRTLNLRSNQLTELPAVTSATLTDQRMLTTASNRSRSPPGTFRRSPQSSRRSARLSRSRPESRSTSSS